MQQDFSTRDSNSGNRSLWISLAILFVLYLACGWVGYGNDNDTYAMLGSGITFLRYGLYIPSRPPGYPLPEIVTGASAMAGGHVLSNGVSALLACLALLCFYSLVKKAFGSRNALLSMLAVGVNPHWVIAASTSMDYAYGAAFFAAGLLLLQRERSNLAALGFAAAVASRLTYGPYAMIAYGVAAWIAWKDLPSGSGFRAPAAPTLRPLAVSCALFLALSFAVYAAIYLAVGSKMFIVYAEKPVGFFSLEGLADLRANLVRFAYKNVFLWGIPVFFILMAACVRGFRSRMHDKGKRDTGNLRRVNAGVWAGVAYCLVLFFRLPLEIAYLLPGLFLAVYLLNKVPRAEVFLVCVIVGHALHGLVTPDILKITYASSETTKVKAATGAEIHPHLRAGILVEDLRSRGESRRKFFKLMGLEGLRP